MVEREGDHVSIYLQRAPGPYPVVMLAVAMLGGLEIIIRGYGVGRTPADLSWNLFLLGGTLVLTSGVALAGIALQVNVRRIAGLYIEQAGLAGQSVLLAVYSVTVLVEAGLQAMISATFFLGFVVAAVWRVAQIQRRIRQINQSLTEVAGE